MMNLFRSLADAGKTVVCITHSLANVERTCHLVVILTAGGKLAFVGKPAEALEYFGIERLGDVYERLAEQPAEHWQKTFRGQSALAALCRATVCRPMPRAPASSRRRSSGAAGGRSRLFLRQTKLLTRRYAPSGAATTCRCLAMRARASVVAVLLGMLFGDLERRYRRIRPRRRLEYAQRSVNLMFLLAVSSFWFGCNNAAKEIVKERTIYTRERDFNVRVEQLLLLQVPPADALSAGCRRWCCRRSCGSGAIRPARSSAQLCILLALAVAA